ncbi:ParA family protein [Entomospira culicis]|uniref:ParA family protein n=1 Tax=Entomospira culicis TaxID=2719989 RepID=A0A968GGI0_9SPIO|nr:ParA family protein [Entomospira culicis]NIZ19860.1 ParA family protein [Entomospira culicis]NIZ70074.1 ParA family protein [Entomospira culicis]WDI37178.1 ParA family protein [Entomospira culicis]WDI38807.1 ParA family protein [Entomospira culicis]
MKSYTLWNNKGGVGKSLLTFILATEYARMHPAESVLVIDMCPQSDISQLLLGGTKGEGKNYEKVDEKKITIGHYFNERLSHSPFALLGTESDYFIHVASYNIGMPKNIYLMCGHNSLEILAPALEATAEIKGIDGQSKHRQILGIIKDLKIPFSNKYKGASCLFIDTNPSFSIYTKMALLAGDQLIIPCLADYGSSLALKNVFHLLYGINQNNSEIHSKYTLKEQAMMYDLSVPIIAHVIFGRSTRYDKGSAQAFKNIERGMREYLQMMKKEYNGSIFLPVNSLEYDLPDMNSLVPVITYDPQVISLMKNRVQTAEGKIIQVNNLKQYKEYINRLVELL